MTIGQIIQRVQSLYSHGVQSDDSRLTPRHIYSKLVSARAMILLQQVKKKNKINDWSFQTLYNIPIIAINSENLLSITTEPVLGSLSVGLKYYNALGKKIHEVIDTGQGGYQWSLVYSPRTDILYTFNNKAYRFINNNMVLDNTSTLIYRTKNSIPKPITSNLGHSIDYVISVDNTLKFDESNKKEMLHIKGNKYTNNTARYVVDNNFIYLYSKVSPNNIEIKMLAEDPLEAYMFTATGNVDVFEVEFSLEAALVDVVIDIATKELVDSFKLQQGDNKNDSEDEKPTR